MSEHTSIKAIKTTQLVDNKSVERLNIIKKFRSLSPLSKGLWTGYGIIMIGSFCSYTYNDGKKSLIEARMKNPNISAEEEWLYVEDGCAQNIWRNFWSSMLFPFTAISNIFPTIVVRMNSKKN
jgi:hypothetical protein